VKEAAMLGASDEEHLKRAVQEKRVIFTQDDDFLKLHANDLHHAEIVYAKQGTNIGKIISGLMLIYQVLSPEDMKSHLEFI
jgi:predicted nuclease of predicted toxin-antitoxin system